MANLQRTVKFVIACSPGHKWRRNMIRYRKIWTKNHSLMESTLIWDHVYLRHLSTEYRSILWADMSTDSRPICRPTVGRDIDRYSADMSAETRSIYRPTVGRHACRATPSDTSPPLGRYFTDTRPALRSFGQLLLLSSIFSTQLLDNLF